MNLLEQLIALVASISELQAKLSDAQVAADELAKVKYEEGFAAGVASVSIPPSDKIYSQEQLDQAIALAVEPLKVQIADLQVLVDAMPSKIAEEVAKIKAELLAKYQELQVIESQAETGFAELLK